MDAVNLTLDPTPFAVRNLSATKTENCPLRAIHRHGNVILTKLSPGLDDVYEENAHPSLPPATAQSPRTEWPRQRAE